MFIAEKLLVTRDWGG